MTTSCRPSSALVALFALGYITSTLAAPALQARAAGVCGSFPYNLFLPLSAYAPAGSYCSSHYPIPTSTVTVTASASTALLTVTLSTDTTTSDQFTVTVTSTAPTITSTAPSLSSVATTTTTTTTTTSTDTISAVAKRAPGTTASSSKTSPGTTSTATSKKNSITGIAAVLSSLESQGASIIKTACSCIETTHVVTKTVTPTTTSTSMVTAVNTVTVDVTTTNTQVTTPISTITPTEVSTTTTTTTDLVVTTTSLACVPTSTQVLANPSFESGSGPFDVTDWTLIGGDPFTSSIIDSSESGNEAIMASADNSGSCAVSQTIACAIVGSPYTVSAYYGYVGGATPHAPVFSIVFEGVPVFTSNVCGPSTIDYDGNSCNGDGNAHYFFASAVVIPTTQTPILNFQFDFLYSSGQAFNGLVDNTLMTLN